MSGQTGGFKRPRKPTATNTVHFACFTCRKSFKQRGSSNWDPDVPQRPFPCPECRQPMVRLGRHFKAPSRRAVQQWLKVELLHRFGERFDGYSGMGSKCPTLSSAVKYLAGRLHPESQVRSMLEEIRASRLD